jgi:N-acetylglucosaminyldiphosphoundecaprenol N-acetyl-beta-D-mannosaminyltransferase
MSDLGKIERVNVQGVGVTVLNLSRARRLIEKAISERKKGYITVTGVHGVTEAQSDPAFRGILNRSFLCTPDGMPLVWMGRLRGHSEMSRVYGPDLMTEIFQFTPRESCRHFFYGGVPGVAEELKRNLENRFPGTQIVGTFTPPFRPLNESEEKELIAMLETSRPDIMWVGLSTPKQEKFMDAYLHRLPVTLMIGVGAAFDFHSGRVKQAPYWMQRSGTEWFYRLCQEPRRLWRRYLKNNPLFVLRTVAQLSKMRKYPLE